MQETLGLLDLRIARLERRLELLRQQQFLSRAYPAHRAKLRLQSWQLQFQLQQLAQQRQELLRYSSWMRAAERP